MFEGFGERRVAATGAEIHLRIGGAGPPLLLLHGYPQTHVMWHAVAPRLAQHFTVVAPDLRGYGSSSKPPAGPDGSGYSKRVMAADQVEVMAQLGFERFAVAAHDRGARVAYRMALDHPERVERLAALDVMPTLDTWESLGWVGGLYAYHWYFLAQPEPFPETLISARPEFFVRHTIESWCGKRSAIREAAMAAYVAAFTPQTIRATCDDYRAGATIDRELDAADRAAGRRIRCPVLALWADPSGSRPGMLDTWKRWADDVRGRGLRCGHFLAEEEPDAVLEELFDFLGVSGAATQGPHLA